MIESQKVGARNAGALINAYLDGHLAKEKREEVESLIASVEEVAGVFQNKTAERKKIKDLVPNKKLSKDSLALLKNEVREVNSHLLSERKPSLVQRVARFLDMTVLEF